MGERKPRVNHRVDPQDIIDNVAARTDDLAEREVIKVFALRLNDEMHSQGISQLQMQDYLDMSAGALSNYRCGKKIPNVVTLRRIADYLGVTSDYLIGKEKAPKRKHEPYTTLTGLDQKAISNLCTLCESPRTRDIMNRLLSNYYFEDMILHVDMYVNYVLPEDGSIDNDRYVAIANAVAEMTEGKLTVITPFLEKKTTMQQAITLLTKAMEQIDYEKGVDGSRVTLKEAYNKQREEEERDRAKEKLIRDQQMRKRNPSDVDRSKEPPKPLIQYPQHGRKDGDING